MDRGQTPDPYKRLFETMLDGAVVLDATTARILLANKAAARIFGFGSPEEMVGVDPLDYVPKEDQERVALMMADSFERASGTPTEIRIMAKDKRMLWVSASVALIEHEGKKATLTTIRDITTDRAKDAALRASEESKMQLIDAAAESIFIVQDGKMVYVNPAGAASAGLTQDKLAGLSYLDFVHPDEKQAVAERYERLLAGQWLSEFTTIKGIDAKGQTRWSEIREIPFSWQGKPAVMSMVTDITDRVRAEEELKEKDKRLHAIIENAWDGISIFDENFNVTFEGPSIARMTGYASEDWMGSAPQAFNIHPDDLALLLTQLETLKSQPGSTIRDVKVRYKHKDGSWRTIEATGRNLLHDPRVKGIVVNFRDITDKVQAEEALKEKEERLRAVVENAWDGVVIFDENYQVVFESPTLRRITGYTQEEWKGSTPSQWPIHPEDLAPIVNHLETLRSQPGSTIGEVKMRFRHKDGSWRWMEATGRNLLQDPKVKGIVANFRDITDRLTAEEGLKASEERFRTLIEKATDVVIVLDAIGKITYQSPSLGRVTGYGPNEWLDRSLSDLLIHPDDMASLASLLQRVLTQPSATVEGVTARYQHKDGSWHVLEATVTNMLHDPKVNGIVANFRDITDRKATEEALQESEQKYRLLVENSTDLIFSLDKQGNFTYVSPAVKRISGYRVDEVIGTSFARFVLPEDLPGLMASFEKTLDGVSQPSEFRARFKDGALRYVRTASRLVMQDGQAVGLTGVMSDITERKEAEEALKKSEALLRDTQELARVGGWEYDVELKKMLWTDEAYRIHEIPNLPTIDHVSESLKCYPPEARQVIQQAFQRCIEEGIAYDLELPFVTFKGNRQWIRTTAKAIREGNETVRVVGNIVDITKRKLAEDALRASEERNRLLIDNANEAITVVQDGVLKFVNPKFAELTGYATSDLVLRPFVELVHPDDHQMLAERYVRRLTGEEVPQIYQFRFLTKAGNTRWAEINAVLFDWEGRPATLGLLNDITERKEVQEILKDSEAKYRRLFESTQTALEVISMETGLLVLANEATAKMFGFASADDLVGVDSMQFIRPEDREFVANGMAQALADKNWQEIAELQVRTNDGRWLWISGMSVQSEYQGKPALLVSLLNITRRKEAEETLRVSEQKYRLLTEKTNDLIWTADLNLHTTYVSPSVERILGLTPEERLKQDATQQMTPESLTRAQEALMKHLALERDPKADPHRMLRVELEYYCKDGSTVWLENQVSGIRDDSGVLIAFHGVARDVSEQKKAQEALKASEIKYKDLFEHTLLGMEVLDGETGKVVLSNRSLARTFGFKSPADMVGINPMDYVLPEDLEWVATQMAELMTDPGWNKVATVRSRTEDGRIIWVTAMTTPFDYEGRPSMLLSLVEATAAKEAQDRLQESELKNRLLIENAAEGIIVVQDGVTRFSNRKCAEITGWSPEELNSKPFLELVHPEDREMIAENYIKRVAGEDAPNNYQFRIIDKQGNTKWLQVNAVQLNWEGKVASLSMLSDVTERVKAEQALRDSEERFRALIEEATDAVAVLDVSGRVLYHSPSLERVTGYALEDWLGKSLGDWSISPEDLASMAANLEVLLKEPGKALEAIKVRYMRKDGSWHTLEATARNMLHDPKIGGIVANFRDITERVKSEEALKESEERYRLFADNVSDVIWVTDMNLKPVYISPSVARMLGYTGDQAMTGAVDTRLTPASAQMALRAYADAMAKEAEHPGSEWDTPPLDLEMVRGDGSTVWMATKFSFIRAADGKPFAILGVLRDVTERKKAEDSLRKSEERFRGLVETTSDWVWELDQNTRYTYVSPKVRDILGYEPRELLGRTPYEFMHQRESRRVARIVRRFATARLPFSLMENTCTHKDGHSVVLETSAVPILDKDGGFLGYRGIDRDITERKKVEQELQRSLKRLEKTMASTIEAITTTIETRDPYTTGHQMRVTDLACAIARVMELTPNQIEGIRVAGLLHDIGKIAIPTEILSKPGRLNDVEYEMIKTHAKVGYNILKKIEFPWPVARSVLQHHERWNGSGYPHGIAGEDILLDARILAVADVMEAMASHRPYRPSVGLDKALDEITKNSGILYDPAVANACATAFTHGFKFAPALPAGESGGPSSDHPVHSLGDR